VGEDQLAADAAGAPVSRQVAVELAQQVEDRVVGEDGDHQGHDDQRQQGNQQPAASSPADAGDGWLARHRAWVIVGG